MWHHVYDYMHVYKCMHVYNYIMSTSQLSLPHEQTVTSNGWWCRISQPQKAKPPDPALPHEPTAAPEILLFSIDPTSLITFNPYVCYAWTAIASSTQVSTSKLCSSLFGLPISCPSNWWNLVFCGFPGCLFFIFFESLVCYIMLYCMLCVRVQSPFKRFIVTIHQHPKR